MSSFLEQLTNLYNKYKDVTLTRTKFISILFLMYILYYLATTLGNTIYHLLILGVGDICTLVGFLYLVMAIKDPYLRNAFVEYVKQDIIGEEE